MNAVIYARYSSEGQREESIDGQIRECIQSCIDQRESADCILLSDSTIINSETKVNICTKMKRLRSLVG